MSSFAQAFDDQVNLVVGENGNLELNRSGSTFKSSLVDLMYKLLRGIPKKDAIDKDKKHKEIQENMNNKRDLELQKIIDSMAEVKKQQNDKEEPTNPLRVIF